MTKHEALKTYFGYDSFRGGQEKVIDALLSGRDALAIMPTGAGKSVCYQIPALLLPGITLVLSQRDRVLNPDYDAQMEAHQENVDVPEPPKYFFKISEKVAVTVPLR